MTRNSIVKTLPAALVALTLAGCHTHPVTPDESWSDYGRYYRAMDVATEAPTQAVDLRIVKSVQVPANIANLKAQGMVELGVFTIEDGTDISATAVCALAQKLNASAAVWSTIQTLPKSNFGNPDITIVGQDKLLNVGMTADQSGTNFAEQLMVKKHEIHMLGKK